MSPQGALGLSAAMAVLEQRGAASVARAGVANARF